MKPWFLYRPVDCDKMVSLWCNDKKLLVSLWCSTVTVVCSSYDCWLWHIGLTNEPYCWPSYTVGFIMTVPHVTKWFLYDVDCWLGFIYDVRPWSCWFHYDVDMLLHGFIMQPFRLWLRRYSIIIVVCDNEKSLWCWLWLYGFIHDVDPLTDW